LRGKCSVVIFVLPLGAAAGHCNQSSILNRDKLTAPFSTRIIFEVTAVNVSVNGFYSSVSLFSGRDKMQIKNPESLDSGFFSNNILLGASVVVFFCFGGRTEFFSINQIKPINFKPETNVQQEFQL